MSSFDDATIITTPPSRAVCGTMTEPSAGADNYKVGSEIARGGMGSILEAEDCKLKRVVALKVMLLDASTDASTRQRFLREAEVLAMLAHPNIVPIHDIVWEDGLPLFYSMKMVKGRTLQHILTALQHHEPKALRDYTLDRLLLIFRKVCDAMAFAHSKGVLHRDLKPENIMVGEFGEVLVMDWGLAKMRNEECGMRNAEEGAQDHSSFTDPLPGSAARTLDGAVMGTPQYMSPEQAMGQVNDLDERSDIFSLGGILYAILTLRPPVEGKTLQEVLEKVIGAQITSPSATTTDRGQKLRKGDVLEAKLIKPLPHAPGGRVPAALSSVAMKALRLEKDQRYQNVSALSADIEAYQGGFATAAEQAGALKQLKLLLLRHKAVAASLLLLLLVSAGFVLKVMASERKATRHAEVATANEQKANANAEETRRALRDSQLALADAAFRNSDAVAMARALDGVPEDLRDQRWDYLSAKRNSSLGWGHLQDFPKVLAVQSIPGKAGQFAVADDRGDVGIVDVRSGEVLRRITTGLSGRPVLAVSEDGQRLAFTARGASEVRLHQVADGGLEKTIPAPSTGIKVLEFSLDARQLLICDDMGRDPNTCTAFMVNLENGSVVWRFRGHHMCAAFSSDGRRLFLASRALRKYFILDAATGELLSEMPCNVASMAMSRDKTRLAFGLHDGAVVMVDVATGKETNRVRICRGTVAEVLWTADDHLLTIGSEVGFDSLRYVMCLWTDNFAKIGTFFGLKEFDQPTQVAIQPLSGDLVVGGGLPQRWHLPVGLEAARIKCQSEQGWSTCFLSDTVMLCRDSLYSLLRYDVRDASSPKALPPTLPHDFTMAKPFLPGKLVAVGKRINASPFSIKLYSVTESQPMELREFPMPQWITGMDFDPAGARLAAITPERGFTLFDVASGKVLLKLPQNMERAVFVGKGDCIAAIVKKKRLPMEVEDELTLFDANSGSPLRSVTHHRQLNELVVSPDRRLIAIAGAEQVIRVLDAATLEERISFRAHDAEITAMAFHPTLPMLASGSADGSVKLWDHETARLRETFMGLDGVPVMMAFSPNGRLLSVEGQERMVRLFDLGARLEPAQK